MRKETVTHEDYIKSKGERYDVKKPKDSDFFDPAAPFETKTQKDLDYVSKKGERYQMKKPGESDIWKVNSFN